MTSVTVAAAMHSQLSQSRPPIEVVTPAPPKATAPATRPVEVTCPRLPDDACDETQPDDGEGEANDDVDVRPVASSCQKDQFVRVGHLEEGHCYARRSSNPAGRACVTNGFPASQPHSHGREGRHPYGQREIDRPQLGRCDRGRRLVQISVRKYPCSDERQPGGGDGPCNRSHPGQRTPFADDRRDRRHSDPDRDVEHDQGLCRIHSSPQPSHAVVRCVVPRVQSLS